MDRSKLREIINAHLDEKTRDRLIEIYHYHALGDQSDPTLDYFLNLESHLLHSYSQHFREQSQKMEYAFARIKSEFIVKAEFRNTLIELQNLRAYDYEERDEPRQLNEWVGYLIRRSYKKYDVSFRTSFFTSFNLKTDKRECFEDDTIVLRNPENQISIEVANHLEADDLWVHCLMIENQGEQSFFKVSKQLREFFNLFMEYNPKMHGMESLVMQYLELPKDYDKRKEVKENENHGMWRFRKTNCGDSKLERYWKMHGAFFPNPDDPERAYFLNPLCIPKFKEYESDFSEILKSINLKKSFYTSEQRSVIEAAC